MMGRVSPASVSTPAYGVTRPVAGITVLILSTWALSTLDASGKWVMNAGVSLRMLCWVRYVLHLVLVLALVLPSRGLSVLRTIRPWAQVARGSVMLRSEEHTSELQSLMRISYAVFCLKKKKKKSIQHR